MDNLRNTSYSLSPSESPLRLFIKGAAGAIEEASQKKGEQLLETHQEELKFLRDAEKKLTSAVKDTASEAVALAATGTLTVSSFKQTASLPQEGLEVALLQAKELVQSGRQLKDTAADLIQEAKAKTKESKETQSPSKSDQISLKSRAKVVPNIFKITYKLIQIKLLKAGIAFVGTNSSVLGTTFSLLGIKGYFLNKGHSVLESLNSSLYTTLGASIGAVASAFITAKNNEERKELLKAISESFLIRKAFGLAAKKLQEFTEKTLIPSIEEVTSSANQQVSDIASGIVSRLPEVQQHILDVIDKSAAQPPSFLSSFLTTVPASSLLAALSEASKFIANTAIQANDLLGGKGTQVSDALANFASVAAATAREPLTAVKEIAVSGIDTSAAKTTTLLKSAQATISSPILKSILEACSSILEQALPQARDLINEKASEASTEVQRIINETASTANLSLTATKATVGTALVTFSIQSCLFLTSVQAAITSTLLENSLSEDSSLTETAAAAAKNLVKKTVSDVSEMVQEAVVHVLPFLDETGTKTLTMVRTFSAEAIDLLKAGSEGRTALAEKAQEIATKYFKINPTEIEPKANLESSGDISNPIKEISLLDIIEGTPPGLLLSTLATKVEEEGKRIAVKTITGRAKQIIKKRLQGTKLKP